MLSQGWTMLSGAETKSPSGEGHFLVLLTLEPKLEGHEAVRKAFWEKRFWCTQAGGKLLWGQNWCFCVQRDIKWGHQGLNLINMRRESHDSLLRAECVAELGLCRSTVTWVNYSKQMRGTQKASSPITRLNMLFPYSLLYPWLLRVTEVQIWTILQDTQATRPQCSKLQVNGGTPCKRSSLMESGDVSLPYTVLSYRPKLTLQSDYICI